MTSSMVSIKNAYNLFDSVTKFQNILSLSKKTIFELINAVFVEIVADFLLLQHRMKIDVFE